MWFIFGLILSITVSLQVVVAASLPHVSRCSSGVSVSLVQTHAEVLRNKLVFGLHRESSALEDGTLPEDHRQDMSASRALLTKRETSPEPTSNSSILLQHNTAAPSKSHTTVVEHVTEDHTKDGDDSTTTDTESESTTETDEPNGTHTTVVEKTTTSEDGATASSNMTATEMQLDDRIGKLEVNFEFLTVAFFFLAFVMCCFGVELVFLREKVERIPTIRVQRAR